MCKESGVSRGSLGDLSKGRIHSLSATALQKIADYFEVSTDYLLQNKISQMPYIDDIDIGNIYLSKIYYNFKFFEKDEDFIELMESIKKEGLLVPIIVRPNPNSAVTYRLVDGARRLLACTRLEKKLIKCIVLNPMGDKESDHLSLEINKQQQFTTLKSELRKLTELDDE